MFGKKLAAVGYPGPEPASVEDDLMFRELIMWIVDNKAPFSNMSQELATKLRESDSDSWPAVVAEFLTGVSCPWNPSMKRNVIDWLLRKCVAAEHDALDCRFQVSSNKVVLLKNDSSKATVIELNGTSGESLFGFSVESPEFRDGIQKLSQQLGIQPHPDSKVQLRALADVLERLWQSRPAVADKDASSSQSKDSVSSTVRFPLGDIPLGMNVTDPVIADAVRILRLLHITELRDLQTRIDEALVSLQAGTANPETNQALGQVGR